MYHDNKRSGKAETIRRREVRAVKQGKSVTRSGR